MDTRNRMSDTSRSRLNSLTAAVAGATLALGVAFPLAGIGTAEASMFQAYSITGEPIPGNQTWTGGLGNDFDVITPINISSLGVFDDAANGVANGVAGTLSVYIFDLSNTAAPLASQSITGSGDPLMGQFRFKAIPTLTLGPGSYSVVAVGFGAADKNGNENVGNIPLVTDDGGGAISFVNSRFGAQGVDPLVTFPSSLTVGIFPCSGQAQACFAAGSFKYAAVPEPGTMTLFGIGIVGIGLAIRRRRAAA